MMLTLAPALLALMALAADPVPTTPPSSLEKAATVTSPVIAKPARPIIVTGVEPKDCYSGDVVTVTGSGLDQGSVLLLGPVSPLVLEATDHKILFRAPETDHNRPEAFEGILFLITPGFAVTSTEATVRVTPPWLRDRTKHVPAAITSLPSAEQRFQTSASKPFHQDLDFSGAQSISVVLNCTGADVEMMAERADRAGERLTRATRGGALDWNLRISEFAGKAGTPELPTKIKATFATDSAKLIPCRIAISKRNRPPV